jgi:outer membrane protein assembly factor BamB
MRPRPKLGPVLATLLLLASSAPADAQDDERRAFSFPLTREARDTARLALDHLEAQRWSKAVDVLQDMLEEQKSAVLPDSYRASAGKEVSVNEAHPGAAAWARARLVEIPREARELYRDRYGKIAELALAMAEESGRRTELIAVAERWPLTDASQRAWRILGDRELEEGHPRAALFSWQRAEDTARTVQDGPTPGFEARRMVALAFLKEEGEDAAAAARRVTSSDPSRSRGPLPSKDAAPWSRELDLSPFDTGSTRAYAYFYSLFPELVRDRVLVSSTLQLYCLDAFTGEVEWSSGLPDGWNRLSEHKRAELFEGLNRSQIIVAPAVDDHIAVASLQLPYSELPNDEFQGIEVMKAIPQRRLFAFDVDTGEMLWNHAPRLEWIPARSTFQPHHRTYADRMLIAAPPTIVDSRVLVPSYVLEGRIDYHVACYELETGELLWSTGIVSGQRSRNMFGRALEEFSSTPVVVAGDRVVVQTELGTVAALDLLTGRILWESLYRQVSLPKTAGYARQQRRLTWRLAPPAVVDGVVVSTPSDSAEMTAFDLADGRVLWTYDQSSGLTRLDTEHRELDFNLLLGADEDTVYLGGGKIGALRKPGGLRSTTRFDVAWVFALNDNFEQERSVRPILCRDSVLVAAPEGRLVLDRRDGRELHTLNGRWDFAKYGNPVVENGLLFTLGGEGLHGFFDWDLLLDRQRRRMSASPDNPEIAIATARLFARRADVALETGELFASLSFLKASREILLPFVSGSAGGDAERFGARASDELHLVLRSEARALEQQGHRAGALDALARARPLARTRAALRDTLLQEERNLRNSNLIEKHLAVLGELERTSSDLAVPEEAGESTWFPLDLAYRPKGGGPTIGLWVLLVRAGSQRRAGNLAAAFDDWHAVLARHPDAYLAKGVRADELARKMIARELATPGARSAYEAFEARAAELYGRALETESRERLREVGRLFPHSRAARDADAALLDWAYETGDAEAVSNIVYGSPSSARPGRDEDGRARAGLLRLASLLGRLGNHEFETALLGSILRRTPEARSDLPEHAGRKVAELLDERLLAGPLQQEVTPLFDPSIVYSAIQPGSYEFIGRFLPEVEAESGPEELHVYLVRSESDHARRISDRVKRVEAFSSRTGERPAWRTLVEDGVRNTTSCAVSAERVILGGEESVQALDTEGRLVWRRSTGGGSVSAVQVHAGVAVAMVGATHPDRALAFDAHSGVPLWTQPMGAPGSWRPPTFGEDRLVFFSKPYGRPATARVIDLFRGDVVADIELGTVLESRLETVTWIDGDLLFVPRFPRMGKNAPRVTAYDLETGTEVWTAPLPDDEEFEYIARHDGKTYLLTSSDAAGVSGGIYDLDTEFGALRRIIPLRTGEVPIGLSRRAITELPTSDLFTYSTTPAGQMIVRALHLPYQARWSTTLRVRDLDPRHAIQLPAISEECVALAYVLRNQNSGLRGEARLAFVDRNTGKQLDTVLLDEDFGLAERLELRGLGEALFVVGRGGRSRGWRMQILEKIR